MKFLLNMEAKRIKYDFWILKENGGTNCYWWRNGCNNPGASKQPGEPGESGPVYCRVRYCSLLTGDISTGTPQG